MRVLLIIAMVMLSATLYAQTTTTLSLATEVHDTYFSSYSGEENDNNGGDADLQIDSIDFAEYRGSIIRLPGMSQVPVDHNIDSVYLVYTYWQGGTGDTLITYSLLTDFDENIASYNFADIDGTDTTFWGGGANFTVANDLDTTKAQKEADGWPAGFGSDTLRSVDGEGLCETIQDIYDGNAAGVSLGSTSNGGIAQIFTTEYDLGSSPPAFIIFSSALPKTVISGVTFSGVTVD